MENMTEEQIHTQVCGYLTQCYPDVIYTSDLSGLYVSKYQAKKISNWKSCRGIPDLLIFEPRGGYYGLLLELKKDGTRVLKKDGTIPADRHLQEQWRVLNLLEDKGYCTAFGVGYEGAKDIIDKYMNCEIKKKDQINETNN
jgi:hypothetical protein